MSDSSLALPHPLLREPVPRRTCHVGKVLMLFCLLAGLGFVVLLIPVPSASSRDRQYLAAQEPAITMVSGIPQRQWASDPKTLWRQSHGLSFPQQSLQGQTWRSVQVETPETLWRQSHVQLPFRKPRLTALAASAPIYGTTSPTYGTTAPFWGTTPKPLPLGWAQWVRDAQHFPTMEPGQKSYSVLLQESLQRWQPRLEAYQSGTDVRSQHFWPEYAFFIGQRFVRWLTQVKGMPAPVRISIGQDPRVHGPTSPGSEWLVEALSAGIQKEGAQPMRLGLASSPAMFASTFMSNPQSSDFDPMNDHAYSAAVMVTASHLPSDWNGMKFFTSDGGLSKEDVKAILSLEEGDKEYGERNEEDYQKYAETHLRFFPESSVATDETFIPAYQKSLVIQMQKASGGVEFPLQGLKIVLNAGNGCGGLLVDVLKALGADTSGSVNLSPDGKFPAHIPNPEDQRMVDATVHAVKAAGADVGVMFDTDVDRSGLIDGKTLEPLNKDRLIAAAARMVLRDSPGATIVTDSVTSAGLTDFIVALGGKHYRFKRGYKNVIDMAKELCASGTDAPLAIETSGHGALQENHWMDDGAFLALRLVTLFATMRREESGSTLSSLISGLREPQESLEFRLKLTKTGPGPEQNIAEEAKSEVVMSVQEMIENLVEELPDWSLDLPNYEGIRVKVAEPGGKAGWFLIRESLHEPLVVMNVESDIKGGATTILEALMRGGLESLDLDLSPIHEHLGV